MEDEESGDTEEEHGAVAGEKAGSTEERDDDVAEGLGPEGPQAAVKRTTVGSVDEDAVDVPVVDLDSQVATT